jgi:heptosyltransferase-2
MKILVIQQKMIGDVLATSIICNNLKLIYPNSQVDYLVYPFTIPVLENNPNINRAILFEDVYRKNKIAFFKFLIAIRKQKYDLVIDAYGKLESNLVTAFSGAKTRIGAHKSYTSFLYSQTVKELKNPTTEAGTALENRLNLLIPLAPSIKLKNKPVIFLTEKEIGDGKAILVNNKIDFSKKIYMISVLGSGTNKTYPFLFMAKLLDRIVEKNQAVLLFNYMPSQEKEAKAIFDLCQLKTQDSIKINIISGNIRGFLSLTYHCDALIGNEGGAVNMAKAINIPTFTIFSPWIVKEAWNSFENEKTNISVHLKDFRPDLFGSKSPKKMKNEALKLYDSFIPELLYPKLENFIKNN